MATLAEIIDTLVSDGDIQVGDGMTDPLVGQLAGGDAKTWELDPNTAAAAANLGYGQGRTPFYALSSPAGRRIGFPFPQPRPNQLEAVDSICDAFKAGYDVLFEAGTGFGKSPAEIGVVSQFESSYLLIGRNDLVDQWERDFEHFNDIGFYKARQRFDCTVIKGQSCAQAKTACNKSRKDATGACPDCPYAVNRDVALSKPHTVMTLSLGLTIFKHLAKVHPGITKRSVIVIDECSELESEIMKFFEFSCSTKTIFKAINPSLLMSSFWPEGDDFYRRWKGTKPEMKFGEAVMLMQPDVNLNACILWAIDISALAQTRLSWMRGMKGQQNEDQEKVQEACEQIVRMAQNMIDCIQSKIPHHSEVNVEKNTNEKGEEAVTDYSIRVAPLEARGMICNLVAPFADHLLYVSATTGTAQMFALSHAYSRPLVKIESPSGFPVANRPIYSLRSGNMSQKTQATDAPKVMADLVAIAKQSYTDERSRFSHADQKGIIHTYNSRITDMVMAAMRDAGLSSRCLVLKGGGRQRQDTMEMFRKSTRPLILVSPSAMLGLSLNDELGRWQAIVKVPYAYLGDQSVVHRKDNIHGWYEWQTAKDLIQTFGRIVRSETDWGITYILDDAFSRFYAQNNALFPRYVQEAVWQKPNP